MHTWGKSTCYHKMNENANTSPKELNLQGLQFCLGYFEYLRLEVPLCEAFQSKRKRRSKENNLFPSIRNFIVWNFISWGNFTSSWIFFSSVHWASMEEISSVCTANNSAFQVPFSTGPVLLWLSLTFLKKCFLSTKSSYEK